VAGVESGVSPVECSLSPMGGGLCGVPGGLLAGTWCSGVYMLPGLTLSSMTVGAVLVYA